MTKTVYPEFVPPSIAKKVFGVEPQTLRGWAKAGKISFIKTPGGHYRYNVKDHLALMAVQQPAPQQREPTKPKVVKVVAKADPVAAPVAVAPAPVAKPAPAPVKPVATPAAMPSMAAMPKLTPAQLLAQIEALAGVQG